MGTAISQFNFNAIKSANSRLEPHQTQQQTANLQEPLVSLKQVFTELNELPILGLESDILFAGIMEKEIQKLEMATKEVYNLAEALDKARHNVGIEYQLDQIHSNFVPTSNDFAKLSFEEKNTKILSLIEEETASLEDLQVRSSTTKPATATAIYTTAAKNENVLIDLIVLFLDIYKESATSLSMLAETATKHKQVQENLNKYSRGFSALKDTYIKYPPADNKLETFIASAIDRNGVIWNQQMYDELLPFLELIGISEGKTWSNTTLNNSMDSLYQEINANLKTLGLPPIKKMSKESNSWIIDLETLKDNDKAFTSGMITAGELNQVDAKYLETMQANLLMIMKSASSVADSNKEIYRAI